MSKSRNGMKKKFKLNSVWILVIVVVAAIIAIVAGVKIADYAKLSPGQKVFNQYVSAAASQDVEGIAKTLYVKGSDEYNQFVDSYKAGKKAYADFLANTPADSDEYKEFMKRDLDMSVPVDEQDPIDLGLRLAVEQKIAKNIGSYTFSSHKSESYYDEFAVTPIVKDAFAPAAFPVKYQGYINDSFTLTFTVKFSSAQGNWLFLSDFWLFSKLADLNTWYAPYGDGVELKYLNPYESLEFVLDENDDVVGIFDTTKPVIFNGEEKQILSIGSFAFSDCEDMVKITLDDSIKNIGEYAFKDCTSLTDIVYETDTIADADRKITVGRGAFYNCVNLKSFTLPKVNKVIPDYLFYNCSAMETFEIHEGTEAIGHYAFAITADVFSTIITNPSATANLGLKNIDIKPTVTAIGDNAFRGQANLIDIRYVEGAATTNALDSSVIRLGANAFFGCINLRTIKLPDSLTKIQEGMFAGCIYLTDVTLPSRLKEIGTSAFASTGLGRLSLPESVEVIGVSAFSNVTSLSVVEWAQNTKIRIIGAQAFRGCSGMYEVTLPKTIKQIGSQAFAGCSRLRVVRAFCDGSISVTPDSFQYQNSIPKFYVENTANYRGLNWNHLEIYSKNIIDESGNFAISDYTSVNAAGQTVTEKMLVQFLGGETVDKVDFEEYFNQYGVNITRIGRGAFAYSQYIATVDFDSAKITAIGENAFVGTNVKFTTFSNTDKDKLFYLKDWLVKAEGALSGSKYTASSLNLASSGWSFVGPAAERVDLPSTKGIASGAFYLVNGLREVQLPSSLVYIGSNAFMNSANITTVEFAANSNLKQIGASAFESCVSIVRLDLPEKVEDIGANAFYNCDGLRYVFVNNSERTLLGATAFTPKRSTLKIYIKGYDQSGSDYQSDVQWSAYKSLTFDKSITQSNGDFAIKDGVLIQYLGVYGEDDAQDISLVSGEGDVSVAINSIFEGAFATANVRSVVIPYTVTSIGDYAFYKCATLSGVTLRANTNKKDSLAYIGDYAFSQTGLDGDLAVFKIDADSPREEGFVMGLNVFDSSVARVVDVSSRENFIKNSSWNNYVKVLAANDDPVVHIRIEMENSTHINGNSVGALKTISKTFTTYSGAPDEDRPFKVTVDEKRGYRFVGWYTSVSGEPGELLPDSSTNYVVTFDEDEKYLIAVFERYATPVNLSYYTSSTSSMGLLEVKSSTSTITESGLVHLLNEGSAAGNPVEITIKATAEAGYIFAGWVIDGVKVSDDAEYTLLLEQDMVIEAMFAPES